MITNSLEWHQRRSELQQQMQSLPYNRELRKMLENIDTMVLRLSNAEVVARRNKRPFDELDALRTVNEAIDTLEQWMIFGRLAA
jgi:hypothetical protein